MRSTNLAVAPHRVPSVSLTVCFNQIILPSRLTSVSIGREVRGQKRGSTYSNGKRRAIDPFPHVYLLIRVLHDWPDEDCLRILRACRAAMRPETLLLIGELILDPDPRRGWPTGYLHDMQMMAMFGRVRERTEAEFRELLAEAGFALRRAIPTGSPISILEAVAA